MLCVRDPLSRSPPLSPNPFSPLCVLESRFLSVYEFLRFPGELEKQQGTKTLSFKAGGSQGDPQSKQGSPTGEFQTWGPVCVEAPPTPQPWGPGGFRVREMLLYMAQPPGASAVEVGGRRVRNVSTDKRHCPPGGVRTLGPSLSADCWCMG